MLLQTKYVDMYRNLNLHLHKNDNNEVSPLSYQTITTTRNPPRIARHSSIVQSNLKRVFGFTDNLFTQHVFYSPLKTSIVHKSSVVSDQTVIDVNYRWCTEYYHFLTEVLPNAIFLNKRYPTLPILCTKSKFTEGMFQWFGIASPIIDQVSPLTSRIQSVFAECGNPSRESIDILRSVVESKQTFEKTCGILIRRHKTRFVENEDELFEECKQKFPTLTWTIFDDLSPRDTAALFSKAAVIVAPHGAGLTNMLFSSSGIAIYEFMPIDEPNICYWHLSELLGNEYTMIPTPCNLITRSMNCKLSEIV